MGWYGMVWVRMGWNGMEWNGVGWGGMEMYCGTMA
jgi:hypothetical protein